MSALTDFCCELCELMEAYEVSLEDLDRVVHVLHKQEEVVFKSFEELNHLEISRPEDKCLS